MPKSYWPGDGCQWSIRVRGHGPSKIHYGGHVFLVLLAASTPQYSGGGEYESELSAKQLRQGIELHYGKDFTLQHMLGSAATAHVATATAAAEEEERGGLSEYELQRLRRMEENTQLMIATGILQPTQGLGAATQCNRVTARKTKVEIFCCSVLQCVVVGVEAHYSKVEIPKSQLATALHM